jgi:hypothetical protein
MLNNQNEETKQHRANLLNMYKQEMIGNQERKNNEVFLENLHRNNKEYLKKESTSKEQIFSLKRKG